MSQNPTNVYPAIIHDLNPKVQAELIQLDSNGQIDQDVDGYPYLLGVTRSGNNHVLKIVRNGKIETIIMATRKQRDPIYSWNLGDGYARRHDIQKIQLDQPDPNARRERQKRTFALEDCRYLVDRILKE